MQLLSDADRLRLDAHVCAASERGLTFVAANVRQTAGYFKCDNLNPALTTSSSLIWGVDLLEDKVNRPLLAYEQLAAHGFPVLLPAKHRLSQLLPKNLSFALMMEGARLTQFDIQRGVGNGMHVAQIGLAMLEVIAGVDVVSSGSAS